MARIHESILKRAEAITWHPQRSTLQPELFRTSRTAPTIAALDEETKAEVETRVSAHIGDRGNRESLIRKEGVTHYQYIRPSIRHRLRDILDN